MSKMVLCPEARGGLWVLLKVSELLCAALQGHHSTYRVSRQTCSRKYSVKRSVT